MSRLPIAKFLALIVIAVVIAAGVWGPFEMVMLDQHALGTNHCFFSLGEAALCGMNVLGHLALWQRIFAALPPGTFVFLAYAFAFLLAWAFLRHLHDPSAVFRTGICFSSSCISLGLSSNFLLLGSVINPRAP